VYILKIEEWGQSVTAVFCIVLMYIVAAACFGLNEKPSSCIIKIRMERP
jgi:hypothetical protein